MLDWLRKEALDRHNLFRALWLWPVVTALLWLGTLDSVPIESLALAAVPLGVIPGWLRRELQADRGVSPGWASLGLGLLVVLWLPLTLMPVYLCFVGTLAFAYSYNNPGTAVGMVLTSGVMLAWAWFTPLLLARFCHSGKLSVLFRLDRVCSNLAHHPSASLQWLAGLIVWGGLLLLPLAIYSGPQAGGFLNVASTGLVLTLALLSLTQRLAICQRDSEPRTSTCAGVGLTPAR